MIDVVAIHRKEYEMDAGDNEKIVIAQAPGRIIFLGDHGQVKDGLYVSSGIDSSVQVAVSFRKDSSIRFFAADSNERKRTTLVNLRYKREDRWANYVKTAINIFLELGCELRGLNFTIFGDIPQNISLASSSAVEVASAMALRRFFMPGMADNDLISRLTASHAGFYDKENKIVDYLTMMNAKKDHFLLINEATQEVKRVKNPFPKHKILLMDSKVPVIEVQQELKQRRATVLKGIEILEKTRDAVSLKDISLTDLDELMGQVNEEVRRRCLFVVEEIGRIREVAKAIVEGDKDSFAKNLFHSHEGLRDLYEVSCPETDWLVKRASETPGVIGARMTGLGFGGCIYVMIKSDAVDEYQHRLEDYERIFGFRTITHELHIAGGTRMILK